MVKAGTTCIGDHPRQRFWCYPTGERQGDGNHRFFGPLGREMLEYPGQACPDCLSHLGVHEGLAHARKYRFAAQTIAAALASVGTGATYADAARTARSATGREMKDSTREAIWGANGTMVADWVGTYGPVVTKPVTEHLSWPRAVALDDLRFIGSAHRRKVAEEMGRDETWTTGWAILGAYALPDPDWKLTRVPGAGPVRPGERKAGYLMALRAVPEVTAQTIFEFLTSIDGRPEYVVADGAKSWGPAVAAAFPPVVEAATGEIIQAAPVVLSCRWHLGAKLRTWLKSAPCKVATAPDFTRIGNPVGRVPVVTNKGLANTTTHPATPASPTPGLVAFDETHELWQAARHALKSIIDWDTFYLVARAWNAEWLLARLGDGTDVRELLHAWPYWLDYSIGKLETRLLKLKRTLEGRKYSLTNLPRTQQLLNLIVMADRGLGDERRYTQVLHAWLLENAGTPGKQRVGVTGGPRLQGVPARRNPKQQVKAAQTYRRRIVPRRHPLRDYPAA